MSKLSNLIFHNAEHKMSSPYGKRNAIQTSAGTTATFHNGTDYSTYGKKLPQYAIEDGEIVSCGVDTANANAKYVWVKYPRIGVKMLHYHLDSINVKKGQAVDKNTILGYTGATGRATGIHLHLEVKDLKTNSRYDPEKFSETYTEPSEKTFFPEKGYFKKGDSGESIKKLCDFFANNVKGSYFGDYLEACVRVFQSQNGLEVDGRIGKLTLAKLEEKGFKTGE